MTITFVNDLRLSEMATGDNSGTWGNVTNTNLELIGEALGYGTEGITTNANTHTSTIADGSTDPVRALYVEYTGTLDSACTITIAPNTVNKVCFIENGTSGSQNIIIKQGSGATITIPPGDTKAVYLDGAGSGAKVVDAFASLSVVDLKVQDDLTVTDDVAIGGTLGVTGIATFTDDIIIGDGKTIGSASTVGAITIASDGDLALTGVVTANAGVVVDTMTLDAATLTATDTFKIDAAADVTIDAGGGDLIISDDATIVGTFSIGTSDLKIRSRVSDKDMIFQGNDGGAEITALTLDMSDAGTAIFNHDAQFPDGTQVRLGADNDMKLHLDGTTAIFGAQNGDMLLDSAADIILDADGADIIFKDAGTQIGSISLAGSNVILSSAVSDEDMIFKGNDNGSVIDALTLDMSDAGAAVFNNAIRFTEAFAGVYGSATILGLTAPIQVTGNSAAETHIHVLRRSADANSGAIVIAKSRSTQTATFTAVANDDFLGQLAFTGDNGSNMSRISASITAQASETYDANGVGGHLIFNTTANNATSTSERGRFSQAGDFMVGHSTRDSPVDNGGAGVTLMGAGVILVGRAGTPLFVNREDGDGTLTEFRKDGSEVGRIGTVGSELVIGTNDTGIRFLASSNAVMPVNTTNNASRDNAIAVGTSSARFDDAFITNGVTTGSDRTEKQDIAALTSTEMLVAARISQTFHTYRWKDAVAAKGDDARIHTGTIAQEVQAAFTAEGLDAGNYAMFMSDTWWEHDVAVAAVEANEEEKTEAVDAYTRTDRYDTEDEAPSGSTSRTRLGIRYPELLSFLAAYNEQRFAAIETRLTALEG